MRTIAVIGASGFVGSTLVERLLAKGEDKVLPFIHSSGNAMQLARRGIELRMLNILNRSDVDTALASVTHVVNCSRGGEEVMLRGLRNLLEAAKRQKIKRFIHLSSVAVYGDPPPPESASENARAVPDRNSYGSVKLQQDELVGKAVKAGLPSSILCPPNISGPGSYFLLSLVDALRSGTFALLEDGSAPCNLIDVVNLSHAIELALDNGPADGQRMFVTDDEETTWRFVVESVMALAQRDDAPPSVTKENLLQNTKAPKRVTSLVRSLKHLISSEVREAIRKDPLWAKLDATLRRGVAQLGKPMEDRLRLAVEGPTKITKYLPAPAFDSPITRQQLRGVRHLCELAKLRLGYRPVHHVAESMVAFRRWYRVQHGMDTAMWPLLQQLS